ncbi:division/cell wall cluster transcriptional repressor MraZ [Jannaschia marina]|uniref:division/cell wall cluster transcriptional repressor MraZ n=1 Tax=Jannaschia marina TaxID=2741674 RepID=UPI001ABB4F59|nr:cell division/cell wall cluster transcriptional repressor MraZ [Jannaschia marina]
MEHRFRGTSTHRVDAKGRVSIPADFRRVLDACDPGREAGVNPRLVLCFGDARVPYYTAYSVEAVTEISDMIDEMDEGDPHREALEDYFYSQAETIGIDDSGRLILKADLRERIGIASEAVFAGKGKTFRIYSPAAPQEATSRLGQVLGELPEGRPITSLLPKKRRPEA